MWERCGVRGAISPGFIEVLDDRTLRIPDYSGNSMFNTLGNLRVNARAGMLRIGLNCPCLRELKLNSSTTHPTIQPEPAALEKINDRVTMRRLTPHTGIARIFFEETQKGYNRRAQLPWQFPSWQR